MASTCNYRTAIESDAGICHHLMDLLNGGPLVISLAAIVVATVAKRTKTLLASEQSLMSSLVLISMTRLTTASDLCGLFEPGK